MNKSKYVINYIKNLIPILVVTISILVILQFKKIPCTAYDYAIILSIMCALCIKSVIIAAMHNKALDKER